MGAEGHGCGVQALCITSMFNRMIPRSRRSENTSQEVPILICDSKQSHKTSSGRDMAATTPATQAFVVRIVSVDYYLARPAPKVDLSYAPLEGTAIDQVPVVRIFGSTHSGQKACVHLHKVSHTMQSLSDCMLSTYKVNKCTSGFPLFLCAL